MIEFKQVARAKAIETGCREGWAVCDVPLLDSLLLKAGITDERNASKR